MTDWTEIRPGVWDVPMGWRYDPLMPWNRKSCQRIGSSWLARLLCVNAGPALPCYGPDAWVLSRGDGRHYQLNIEILFNVFVPVAIAVRYRADRWKLAAPRVAQAVAEMELEAEK